MKLWHLKYKIELKNDNEIWEKFKGGDKSALSYIYFQYFNSMYQYGVKFKNDPEFIKDCIQDVFFKLIKAGKNLGMTGNIQYYLLNALKNTIYKKVTREKVNNEGELQVKFEAYFSLEEEIIEKESTTNKELALAKALTKLSNRQREIIYLRYECNMEYEQICEIMQLKNDSARKLVFRAIASLRKILEDKIKASALFFMIFSKKYSI